MDGQSCREQVVSIARKMAERQMVNTNEGNVSVCEGGRVYITPSQVNKESLTPDMIVVTDLQGNQLEGHLKASSETRLHLEVYRLRPDVHAVVHDHSPFATAFAIARLPIATQAYTEMIFLYDRIPVVAYGTPGTAKITAGLDRYIHQTDIFLLANHGVVAIGPDVVTAYQRAEAVESMAKTLAIARLLGGEHPIEPEGLAELYQMRQDLLGKGRIE